MTHKNSDNSKNPKNQIFHNKGILEYDIEQWSNFNFRKFLLTKIHPKSKYLNYFKIKENHLSQN